MKSDLKKHDLLKLLSIQRQNSKTPIGIEFESILKSMKINKEYLDFICGELYGNKEIGFFDNGNIPKGLYAKELGVSAYSSEKYKRIHFKERWISARNWIDLILAIFSIPFQIYRHLDSKADKETQVRKVGYNQDNEMTEQRIEKDQDTVLSISD